MLDLRDVRKAFASPGGEAVVAVDGVTLSIQAGELLALYGPSGSGKSTLLKIIAAVIPPDSGTVTVCGADITQLRGRAVGRYRLKQVGFIPQDPLFWPGATAIDNAGLKLYDSMNRKQAREQVRPLLERLGVGDRSKESPRRLSRGEQQRVLIARALARRPPLLLADEPTGNLDVERSRAVLALLKEVSREHGSATLLVTHDPDAAEIADRALALRDGRLSEYIPSPMP